MKEVKIELPLTKEKIKDLHAGDKVILTGQMIVARDAAHKRLYDAHMSGQDLPVDISGQTVYYMGPSPARDGKVIGSAGPTTSTRMDKYTPTLLRLGLAAMIGKGKRSPEVKQAIKETGAIYLCAIGGCGALLSKCITESEVIAYDDLGPEAIRLIMVNDFPCIVATDCYGQSVYRDDM